MWSVFFLIQSSGVFVLTLYSFFYPDEALDIVETVTEWVGLGTTGKLVLYSLME